MLARFKRYVLLALLLTIPLQGAAAMMHALDCTPHEGSAAAVPGHTHAGGEHAPSHHHPDESTGGSDYSGHQCCHHFSAAPSHVSTETAEEQRVFLIAPPPLERSAVLERPQRPPRA